MTRFFAFCGAFFLYALAIVRSFLSLPLYFVEIMKQVYFIGNRSLGLTSFSGLSIGVVLALQTIGILQKFGAVSYVATVVSLSIVKELGPVITALMVAGRAGSGVCAQIGSMKVTRQVAAMQIMNVDPIRFLLRTRVLAFIISTPVLTLMAILVGNIGGMAIAVSVGNISTLEYMNKVMDFVTLADILEAVVKSLCFGLLIGLVSTYLGYTVQGGTREVGIKTTDTVVISSMLIFFFDILITKVF